MAWLSYFLANNCCITECQINEFLSTLQLYVNFLPIRSFRNIYTHRIFLSMWKNKQIVHLIWVFYTWFTLISFGFLLIGKLKKLSILKVDMNDLDELTPAVGGYIFWYLIGLPYYLIGLPWISTLGLIYFWFFWTAAYS